jgi:hypothetical protein
VQCDVSCVGSWITAAVRHNVEDLAIRLKDFRGQFSLPHCVFTCDTVKLLLLDMPCILKAPPIICFSNIIVLRIESVTFSDDYTTQQFFSGLPVLEVSQSSDDFCPQASFSNHNEADLWNQSCDGQNDCDDHHDFESCCIMIFEDNIKWIFYTGEFFNVYWFYNSFSLERAKIDVTYSTSTYCYKRRRQGACRMLKVLIKLANVNDLRLYAVGFAKGSPSSSPM